MSLPEKGRVLPKRGNVFPRDRYVSVIADALRRDLGNSHRAIKTVAKWTGASERTVKNWFACTSGPSGEHLIALVSHSSCAFEAFLHLAGKEQVVVDKRLTEMRDKLADVLDTLVRLTMDHE